MIAAPLAAFSSRISSKICACRVTSSAVVGSSAISSRGSQASAIAIITRWRMPPESLCGYSSIRRSGEGMWTRRSSSMARSRALRREPPRWRRMVSMIWSPMVKLGLSDVIGS